MAKRSLGKIIFGVLMIGLLIWQAIMAYFVHGVSQLFGDIESPRNMIVFIAWSQPLIWIFMFLTMAAIYDGIKRPQFLTINSILVISIIAVANLFLQLLVMLAGYAPIFDLGNPANG